MYQLYNKKEWVNFRCVDTIQILLKIRQNILLKVKKKIVADTCKFWIDNNKIQTDVYILINFGNYRPM